MTGRTAQDMRDHGAARIASVIKTFGVNMHVVEKFAIPSHVPPPGQLMVHIDGYDYLVTIEFQDPR